jgi:pilus assembly protein Flp/PilA
MPGTNTIRGDAAAVLADRTCNWRALIERIAARLFANFTDTSNGSKIYCDYNAVSLARHRSGLAEQSGSSAEKIMRSLTSRFVKDTSGATAIEYGLIASGIAVAIIAVVQGLGTKLTATFQSVSDNLK